MALLPFVLYGAMTNDADIARLAAHHFQTAHLRGFTRLTGGVSADVVRVDLTEADGSPRSIVFRIHGPTHAGHDAAFEFELLQALFKTGLPIAEPLFVDARSTQVPFPYLAMAFVDGTTKLEDENAQIKAMAQMLFAIHQTATNALPSLPLRIDPLPEVLEFLPTEPEWQPLREHLSGLSSLSGTAFEEAPRLLHGDFWPENLIWSSGDIKAVLDWEDAALGDPLSDVACTCLELRYLFGDRGADQFRQAYAVHEAIDEKRLALWQVYVAAAAQKYMGEWRLDPARETHMCATALQAIRDAARILGV